MKLLIDDTKTLEGVDLIARSYQAGYLCVALINEIEELYMDHDLGSQNEKETGYALLKLFIQTKILPNKVILVTNNPVGRENMRNLLIDNGYQQINTSYFLKETKK